MALTDDEAFAVLERSKLEMGSNYLITRNKTVYQVCAWALGGTAFKAVYFRGDRGYHSHYMAAVKNPHTLFEEAGLGVEEEQK